MRPYLAAFLLALCPFACGDDGSSGGGLPHETCEAVAGLAPCCDPPAADEIVCPEGSTRSEAAGVACRDADGLLVGDLIITRPDAVVTAYGSADVGRESVSCNTETGRMDGRFRNLDEFGRSCELECWDDEGVPITCEMPCE